MDEPEEKRRGPLLLATAAYLGLALAAAAVAFAAFGPPPPGKAASGLFWGLVLGGVFCLAMVKVDPGLGGAFYATLLPTALLFGTFAAYYDSLTQASWFESLQDVLRGLCFPAIGYWLYRRKAAAWKTKAASAIAAGRELVSAPRAAPKPAAAKARAPAGDSPALRRAARVWTKCVESVQKMLFPE